MTGMGFCFLIGLLGSAHCLGMCGPIVVATSLARGRAEGAHRQHTLLGRLDLLWLQSLFHMGRLLTYALLGGLAACFSQAAREIISSPGAQSLLTSLYGVILILLGLALMKSLPIPPKWVTIFTNPLLAVMHRIPGWCESRNPGAPVLLGLFTGLLPCCLSWSMVITAASAHDPIQGSLMMIGFGAGTLPALFAAGISASYLTRIYRRLGETLPGLLLAALGIYLILYSNGMLG